MANINVVSILWSDFLRISQKCNVCSFPAPCGESSISDPPLEANTIQRLLTAERTILNGSYITTVSDWNKQIPSTVTITDENGSVNSVGVTSEDINYLANVNLGFLQAARRAYSEPFKGYDAQTSALDSAIERLSHFISKLL